jgi:hypothetical protein
LGQYIGRFDAVGILGTYIISNIRPVFDFPLFSATSAKSIVTGYRLLRYNMLSKLKRVDKDG